MRNLFWAAALVVLAVVTLSEAQYSGSGSFSSAPIETSPPPNPTDGQLWTRKTDLQRFVYSDSLGKWLGELQVIHFCRAAANASGQLRLGENATQNTTAPYNGFDVWGDSLRIMEVIAHSFDVSTVAACTTFVWASDNSALKLVWNSNTERWIPGDSGWISSQGGAPRYAVPPGTVLGVTVGGGGSVLPDNPNMFFYCRREVVP